MRPSRPDGTETVDEIPLSCTDLLSPEEGDDVVYEPEYAPGVFLGDDWIAEGGSRRAPQGASLRSPERGWRRLCPHAQWRLDLAPVGLRT